MPRFPAHCSLLLLSFLSIFACSLNQPSIIDSSGEPDSSTPLGRGGAAGSGGSPAIDSGAQTPPGDDDDDEVLPSGCTTGMTRACGPNTEAGICRVGTRVCLNGAWGECIGAVSRQKRLCTSSEDNDCDGQPDDSVDDVCKCVPASTEPCNTHPGLDGVGLCRAGSRTCAASPDGLSSDWGACVGGVGPGTDSCLVRGDDADCNGLPNTGCACVEGEQVPCGPPNELGICRKGTSTCANNAYGACVGAVLPALRNCASAVDNNCDGSPDNTLDTSCTCAVTAREVCGAHPGKDGTGICLAGSRTCAFGADTTTSTFSACAGSVDPVPRRCTASIDGNCDGALDNVIDSTCACVIGSTRDCNAPPVGSTGPCRPGLQLCVAGSDNTSSSFALTCSGSVAPALRDSCTLAGDNSDCVGGPNTGCDCVAGQGNGPCSDTPATARCDATGSCVPCVANTDCGLVSGRNACTAGVCVECSATVPCSGGRVCNLTTRTCSDPPDAG